MIGAVGPLARIGPLLGLLAVLCGCNTLIPAHADSYKRRKDRLVVETLSMPKLTGLSVKKYKGIWADAEKQIVAGEPDRDIETLRREYVASRLVQHDAARMQVLSTRSLATSVANWSLAFDASPYDLLARRPKPPGRREGTSLAGLAGQAVGWGAEKLVGLAKTQLEREAERYESKWKGELLVDNFYSRSGTVWNQDVFALRVRLPSDDGGMDDFEVILGLCPTRDRTMLRVAPLYYERRVTGAKILDTRGWSLLPPFLWQHLLDTGTKVASDFKLKLVDQRMSQPAKGANGYQWDLAPATLLETTFKLPSYDLSAERAVGAKADSDRRSLFRPIAIIPMPSIPVLAQNNDAERSGNVLVKITVTDKDPSNAREYIEKAREAIPDDASTRLEALLGGLIGVGASRGSEDEEEETPPPQGGEN